MTTPRRRRSLAGALAATAIVLTGCAVPGQEGSPASAVEIDDTVITNDRVADLYQAWTTEGHVSIDRRAVITLEVLREPMLEQIADLGLTYSREDLYNLASALKVSEGVEGEPSEELVDGLEAAYLLSAFAILDTTGEAIADMSNHIATEAVTSNRTGEWDEVAFAESLALVAPTALNKAQAGEATWMTEFSGANGFVDADEPWIAGE
ncbi:hypothetical protein ON058_10185 [Demequina sp. B12]|uniref:hypothetical protein n=1 Tax=Demequina sp. B12 TaxID=2992757 RepID=UPI00237A1449|nr:hypothetical protein [Demequina sp. B12]MDE0573778.1 hypothetical protein [Demequina sp. B12]